MRTTRVLAVGLAVAVLVAVGLVATFRSAPAIPSDPPTGLVISGRVTDAASGAPVANACITLGPPSACFTRTNGEGRYVIDLGALAAAPGSQWDLHALRDPDYAQSYSGVFTVSGPVVKDFQLTRK